MERRVFAAVITAPGGEIDATAGQQIDRRPLLGDADRVMQWQDADGGGEADLLCARRDMREHEIGAGKNAERRKMMFADPRRMQPDVLGIDGLVEDVGDELIGAAPVVDVVIVAQREIAEFYQFSPMPARNGANLIGRSAVPSPGSKLQRPPLWRRQIRAGSQPSLRHSVHFSGWAGDV